MLFFLVLKSTLDKSANTQQPSSFYTLLAGQLFILLSALTMGFCDTVTFDMRALALKDFALNFQLLLYAGFLIAYAVKLPIIPLYTPGYLMPTGSTTAPVHMLLAGILLKMGGYA